MSHSIAGCASTARSTSPTSTSKTISNVRFHQRLAYLLSRSSSSARGTHWWTDRAPHRGPPLHPRADQAPRNLRGPGRHRYSRTCGCSRNSRSRWSNRRRRVKFLGVIASSPTDIQPVLDVVAATAAKLCEATDAQIRLLEGDGTRLVASFGSLPAPEFILTVSKLPARVQ